MLQIKTFQLNEFAKLTSQIQDNKANPLLSYLKLTKDGTLTKSNQEIYFTMQVDFLLAQSSMFRTTEANSPLSDDLLIHEDTLFGLVESTKSEAISIDVKNGSVIISDGKTTLKHQVEDIALFPITPKLPETEPILLDKQILQTIKTAKAFCSSDPNQTNFQAVHMNDNYIAGISFHTLYVKEFDQAFTNVIFTHKMIDIITQFESVELFDSDKNYFFKPASGKLFVFTKTEFSTPDFRNQINKVKEVNIDRFKIQKSDIIDFCELANKISSLRVTSCKLSTDSENGSQIILNDTETHKEIKMEVHVDGYAQEYSFSHKLILPPLKALKQNELDCLVASNALIVFEDSSFACFYGN